MEVRSRLPEPGPRQPDWRSRKPCQFFAQRRCRNGASCPFSHTEENRSVLGIGTGPDTAHHPSDTTPQVDSRSRIPCRFLLRGSCLKGEKCPFAHDIAQDATETIVEVEVFGRSYTSSWHTQVADSRVGTFKARELVPGAQRRLGQLRRRSRRDQS